MDAASNDGGFFENCRNTEALHAHSPDEIIVRRMDPEGSVSPWLLLAEDLDLVDKWLPFNLATWQIEPEDLSVLLGHWTRLPAPNCASNLTGSINDVAALVELTRSAEP